jgi:hypothetical protein
MATNVKKMSNSPIGIAEEFSPEKRSACVRRYEK